MLVPHSRLLIPLDDLDPRDAAPLSDAALTPYHAIKRSLHRLTPGSTAVVVGSEATLALAGQALAFEGDLTLLGLAGGTIEYGAMTLPWGARIATTYWGTAAELMEVLNLAQSGSIEIRTERVPLEGVADAYARLARGEVESRIVAWPSG